MIGYIYALKHPVTMDIFYIGATRKDPFVRFSSHISQSKLVDYPVYKYINSEKIIPMVEIIKTANVNSFSDLMRLEKRFIRRYLKDGYSLKNSHKTYKMPSKKLKSLKTSDAAHYELKMFVANNPSWKMESATDEAIFLFLREKNHVFAPLKPKKSKTKHQ